MGHRTDVVLVQELQRVLGGQGIALLDVGPALPAAALIGLMTAAGFRSLGLFRSWWLDPTGQVVFQALTGANA